VTTAPETIIRHGSRMLALADVSVGDHVVVKGTVTPAGVTATEIKVQERRGEADDDDDDVDEDDDAAVAEVSGAIAGKTGTCPALSFTVGTNMVTTDSLTVFHETTCDLLADSVIVEVKGTLQPDGSVLASRIETVD
jgi:hypothetical protein